ncbi:MAG: helix-turn-helix domain-containing protein [Actinobacteria bacterium]|nr:helix-turn-helix domain-containing protein [Actinomycetota bacterium]
MTTPDWQAVAAAVKNRRAELGMKQKELAEAAGFDPSTIRNVETAARSSYDYVTLAKISTALKWLPDALDRISKGADPAEMEPEVPGGTAAHDGSIEQLATLVRELQDEVRELRRQLEERTD